MLFVIGLGLTIGSSKAMDHNPVEINNQRHWNMFLMSLNWPSQVKTNRAKPKSKVKSKVNKAQQSKSKKPRQASQARNAEFFSRELNQQKNELSVAKNRADQYQTEKTEWKYRDRLKQQQAYEKERECVKNFARNSERK